MIELHEVSKRYPNGVTALDSVTLSIAPGEIHGIVGQSGAGKSTLIRCLTGLDPATSGRVVVDGVDLGSVRGAELQRARRRIGMVFQHVHLLDSRTAEQNVSHPLEVAGVPAAERKRRVAELLDIVGLSDRARSYPAQLSGGQRQRVGIARALAAEPPVLLCDEPTSALDSGTTRQILQLIRSLRDRLGITVVIITHEMSVVREICNSVSLLDGGVIRSSGPIIDAIRDAGSALSDALVPLPPIGDAVERSVEVLVADAAAGSGSGSAAGTGTVVGSASAETLPSGRADGVESVLELLRREELPHRITAGTIEDVRGAHVARLRLEFESGAAAARALTRLHAVGVSAEPARRGGDPEPVDPDPAGLERPDPERPDLERPDPERSDPERSDPERSEGGAR